MRYTIKFSILIIVLLFSILITQSEDHSFNTKMIYIKDKNPDGMGPSLLLTSYNFHPKDNEAIDKPLLLFVYKNIICDTLFIDFLEKFIIDYNIEEEHPNKCEIRFELFIVHYHIDNTSLLNIWTEKERNKFLRKLKRNIKEKKIKCPIEFIDWINYYINQR